MKRNTRAFLLLALFALSIPAFSQKYRKIQDTARLNKEYINLTNDIAALNAKLTITQNNLPGYQSKASNANEDAADAASASSTQAAKATNGNIKDAKTAKRKAKKAYKEAKDSRSANGNVSDEEEKITDYKKEIRKKQLRLERLDQMLLAINAKISADSIPNLQ